MEFQDAKKIISESKNIYLVPEEATQESITSALALFYTLRELGKNVNIIAENVPENFSFLTPSLDFITYPKNFIISIPSQIADVSQIYYEKTEEALKIHLTIQNGIIKKDDISFYFSESKPDLVITVGVKDYHSQLSGKLNPFGFLLDAPILNIDNSQDNKKFGKINLISETLSLSQNILDLIKELSGNINKNSATCILAGLVVYTNNFDGQNVTAEIFETAGSLMKSGANLKEITLNICRK